MAQPQDSASISSDELVVWRAAERVRQGASLQLSRVARCIASATKLLKVEAKVMERVCGDTIVFGPIRGHAADFANILLTKVLPNRCVKNIVFLGNYIDGAHQSLGVLFLIAALIVCSRFHIVPLIGKHEMMYPIQPETFGSLRNEMLLCCTRRRQPLEQYESIMKEFFSVLPIACVVENRFFCVAGGPSSKFRTLEEIELITLTQDASKEFALNKPMDEDEERIADGSAFVASQENELAFRYTFNAACNFLSRNKLAMLIVGMEYHMSLPDYDSFARPNHYKESIYFPGYMLGRIHPETQLPAVLSMFSAPSFCGVNRNNACIAEIADNRLVVQELGVYAKRPLVSPGTQDHAFSWAQPMLERAVVVIARDIIRGVVKEDAATDDDAHRKRLEEVAVSKMRRMCMLLRAHDLPLPDVPKLAFN
ncbi:hypothetical protein conserved [Leishmania donovani]|uniref:Serine/threonine specific protein phosphatases domain-containing protein n=4 Tax=Leishmania donovani species complex TaxID=38574 RepID=A4HV49_LEIIN|nr:conserved hypothetical protein [Leishmania infantum JPCM5]XP_003859116.1 uncharacterized protein LDBPK_120050 [Leishmania donovani]CAC9462277.1 hypothetical_protein_-_conserved [Leishmania infantum]AYU76914.1 hypothetical protein LdCL_120005500 [Leishmania donovani]CAJ1986971.1 hypothetical protein conserved [Leishmania donovani]CAM66314.2 conserved hypothetical protein [Leishmania infantum JPCM5]CBZ32404.1 unnamed protein product [Leishmania donovani]|eukprot:XP_001463940.2 conserved hypothetical protein [Leishmania infantum JPCM5]